MIDSLLALAATLVNIYVLYMLYLRHGLPDMFNTFPGLVAAGLTAASATYLIISAFTRPTEPEYAGEEYNGDDAGLEIQSTPIPWGESTAGRHNGLGGDDPITRALARAIEKAELRGDIGLHVQIPEHEIDIGGHKASVRGQMIIESQPPAKKEEPASQPLILHEPPTGDPVKDFLKRKLIEKIGG